MNVELTRFKVKQDKSHRVDEWMQLLNDNMKEVLKDIQNGNFANRFVKDNENGFKEFYELREQQHGHEIEAVGRELRKMMPFIKAKSIQK